MEFELLDYSADLQSRNIASENNSLRVQNTPWQKVNKERKLQSHLKAFLLKELLNNAARFNELGGSMTARASMARGL